MAGGAVHAVMDGRETKKQHSYFCESTMTMKANLSAVLAFQRTWKYIQSTKL